MEYGIPPVRRAAIAVAEPTEMWTRFDVFFDGKNSVLP